MTLDKTYQLIVGALDGSQGSYGALLERIRPRLVLWCASRMSQGLRAKVEAEDIAQEVLLAVHKALPALDGVGEKPFFKWVFRIAENRIRDLVDYHGALKRQPGDPLSFTQTTPSRAAARVETAARIRDALAELSEDHRTVIQLRRIEERSFAEVAEAMDRRIGAARVLFWRAMKALAQVLRRQAENLVTGAPEIRSDG